jgi:outer membrane protein insertion porin family
MAITNKPYGPFLVSYKALHHKQRLPNTLCLVLALALLSSCTATKFLKEGETFYAGAEIQFNPPSPVPGQKRIQSNLQTLVTPKPNPTFLGLRPAVWFYGIAGTPKKQKGFRNFIKNKLGSAPVVLTDATPDATAANLENQLNNDGYFRSTVTTQTETKGKKSTVIYTVHLQQPYHLRNIKYAVFDTDSLQLELLQKGGLLKAGQRYQLDRLQAEQKRIDEGVKNMGYFYFDDRYLLFMADSAVGNRQVDVDLQYEAGIPEKATRIYRIKTITVLPDYTLGYDSLTTTGDTLKINDFTYIDNHNSFRPKIITDVITMKPNNVYSRAHHEYTLSRLMSLKTFKFVTIKFTDDPADSAALHARIFLTPLLKKSLQVQTQFVSKSNNFVGPGFEATFTNRNLLRGAEMFRFKVSAAYESQISSQQAGALNAIELGAESSLFVPRFIPLRIPYRSAKYVPQTQFTLGAKLQQRLGYFRLTSFNVGYGHIWRETTLKTHELFPVDVSFVKLSNTSAEFDALLEQNATLANSFQNQFLLGSRYAFTLNTQLSDDIEMKYQLKELRKSNFYLNAAIDISGNIFHSLQSMSTSEEGPYQFFRSPYSQYTRGMIDFRHYFQFNKSTKLVTRFVLGAAFAYGNSTALPYIKQFAIGGSNSLRAFPARSIGPGTYNIRTDTTFTSTTYFIDQRGDIKLQANLEYRFDIVNALKGAVFLDAGNIWLVKEDESREGGKFDRKTFISELAAGTGLGIRYDFSFFVLRFDVAFPIRKPYLEPSGRWVINEIDFGSSDWRRNNLILNVAIGYPF